METLGLILVIVGAIGLVICGIWLLIEQFKTSILWGLGCLLIPFIALIWLAFHWDEGKRPFGLSLCFAVLFVGGGMLKQ